MSAANHTDAGSVTQDIVGILGIDTADNSDTAAVELGKGVTGGTQDPQLRSFVVRVPLGHGQTAGTDRTADKYLAVGHGVADTVGRIAENGNLGTNIEITDIIGSRTFADDGGAGHSHATKTLAAWTFDLQCSVLLPRWSRMPILCWP